MSTGGAEPSVGAADGCPVAAPPPGGPATTPQSRRLPRRRALIQQVRVLVRAIDTGDDDDVGEAVLQLSRRRRWLAPLALAVGAFVMLFQGLRMLVANWRLTLIQIVPAMWIWAAMLDLKLHVLEGRELRLWYGAAALSAVLGITLIAAASFYLNAVFAFAISRPGKPEIRPAFSTARSHLGVVLAWGVGVGLALGAAAIIVPRWGSWWFVFSMSIVIAVMMLTYVAVPARLVGIKARVSRRDKLTAAVVGGAVGAIVCTPPYVVARIGILLLGSDVTFVIGVVLLAVGFTLQAGATGAVKAIKMSAKLVAGNDPTTLVRPAGPPAADRSAVV